jgi:hypothetical protein
VRSVHSYSITPSISGFFPDERNRVTQKFVIRDVVDYVDKIISDIQQENRKKGVMKARAV